jgi:restriction system protein
MTENYKTCQLCGGTVAAAHEGQTCPLCKQETTWNYVLVAKPGRLEITGQSAELTVTRDLVEHWKMTEARRAASASIPVEFASQVIRPSGIPSGEAFGTPSIERLPDILIPVAVVVLGDKTSEGRLVDAVGIAWFEIIKQLSADPHYLYNVNWRTLEEVVAGAYEREGWPEVILTPRSGDGGRDVIVSKPGLGAIRFYDQVKAYKPGQKVPAEDVRALLGVLTIHPNVSKAVITTTALFAPGVTDEMKALIPYRLELRDGPKLREWLMRLGGSASCA